MMMLTAEKLFIPPGREPQQEKANTYGRQVPESESEEIQPEGIQDQQRCRQEAGGGGQQTSRRQEEVTARPDISPEIKRRRDEFTRA